MEHYGERIIVYRYGGKTPQAGDTLLEIKKNELDIFEKNREMGLFGYQSNDMKKNGKVLYTKKEDLDLYKKTYDEFMMIRESLYHIIDDIRPENKQIAMSSVGMLSDIDISKLKRSYSNVGRTPIVGSLDDNDEVYNYKYAIQLDSRIYAHTPSLLHTASQMLDSNIPMCFVPYMGDDANVELSKVTFPNDPKSGNIALYPNKKFVHIKQSADFFDFLKKTIPGWIKESGKDPVPEFAEEMFGKLIAGLYKSFTEYDDLGKKIQNNAAKPYASQLVDFSRIQKESVYCIEKDAVRDLVIKRQQYIEKYQNEIRDLKSDDPTEVASKIKDLYRTIAGSEKFGDYKLLLFEIDILAAKYVGLDILSTPSINELTKDNITDSDEYIKACADIKFNNLQRMSQSVMYNGCHDFFKYIPEDNEIVDKIKKLFPVHEPTGPTDCVGINKRANPAPFDMHFEHMPEWYDTVMRYVENATVLFTKSRTARRNAFYRRPLVLGEMDVTFNNTKCSDIVYSDPFTTGTCTPPELGYSIELNKAVIACSLNKKLIFPIMVINTNMVERTRLYSCIRIAKDDVPNKHNYKYLGCLLIKFSEGSYGKPVFFSVYMYVDVNNFNLHHCNFRGNYIRRGTILEDLRPLCVEMNTLQYAEQDLGYKLHFYKVMSRSKIGTYDLLVSRYDKETIKNKYLELEYFKDKPAKVDELVDALIEVTIEKNYDRRHIFKNVNPTLKGGGNQDIYRTKYLKYKAKYLMKKKNICDRSSMINHI